MSSFQLKELYEALDKFHDESPLVKADKTNPFLKNKYADYNTVVSETRPDLKVVGLRVKQSVTNIDGKTAIRTTLTHIATGQMIEDVAPVESKPGDPQSQGSGITYQKRYSYIAMLDLLVDVDDDGSLSHKLKEKSAKITSGVEEAKKALKASKSLGDLQKTYSEIYSKDKRLGQELVPFKDELKEKLAAV